TVEYDDGEIVRRVGSTKAYVSFKGRLWKVPEAFCSEQLAIRPRSTDGQYGVFFGVHEVAHIDLTKSKCVGHVPGLNNKPGHDDGQLTASRQPTTRNIPQKQNGRAFRPAICVCLIAT